MAEKRSLPGRITRCPSCNCEIRYSWLSGMSGPHIHLYANDSNDVLIRTAWFSRIRTLMEKGAADPDVLDELGALMEGLSLPLSAKYSVWNNVKCPKCKVEFPYRFKGNLKVRLEDQEVILIDGCSVNSDSGFFIVNVESVS